MVSPHSIVGRFHHISDEHINNYLSEFNFRWITRHGTDGQGMLKTVKQ